MAEKDFGEIEFEFLDEELEIQKSPMGRWARPLKMFLQSGKKSMIFRVKSKEEQTRGITAVSTYIRNYNLDITVGRHGATEIYVVRA